MRFVAACKSRKGSLAAAAAAAGLEIVSTTHVSATIRVLGHLNTMFVPLAELGDDGGIRDGDVGGTVVGPESNKALGYMRSTRKRERKKHTRCGAVG